MGRNRVHSQPTDAGDEQRPCARGERCLAATITVEKGKRTHAPTLTYRTFCPADRNAILHTIEELPGYYQELGDRAGDKTAGTGPKVSGSRAAPLPINLTFDSLRVDMTGIVASWATRIYVEKGLTGVQTDRSLWGRAWFGAPLTAYSDGPFQRMCETLAGYLDTLLALGPEPMSRFLTIEEAAKLPEGTPGRVHPHAGYAEVFLDLSGADAGREVFKLAARCRFLLGYTGKAEKIPGRCFGCEMVDVLVRPDSAAGLVDFAECSACGQRYLGAEYTNLMRDVYEREVQRRREAS